MRSSLALFTAALPAMLAAPPAVAAQERAKCAACHPKQAAAHSASAHARSLARDGKHGDWAFGAGKQAITYVSRVDESHYVEHSLTYYKALNSFDLTPGHTDRGAQGVRYRVFDPSAAILRCFQCHSTGAPAVSDQGVINPAAEGVQCKACHGSGQGHPQQRNAIRNPGRITAKAMNEACGLCHRKPAPTGGDTDFTDPWNARHQPLFLARSQCFLRSNGRLKCTTCHDAHSGEAKPACASCHANPAHPTAVAGACETCHMPLVKPRPGLAFANHWIGIYRGADPLRPSAR